MRARAPGRRSPSRYPETAAIRARLDEYGGAILGDKVGAGKTFVTFALIAEAVLRDDSCGAVIFVPCEIIARKWVAQLREYLEVSVRDPVARTRFARRVTTMGRSLRTPEGRVPSRKQIVVMTHSVFSYGLGSATTWSLPQHHLAGLLTGAVLCP
jgi:hypothetical protein